MNAKGANSREIRPKPPPFATFLTETLMVAVLLVAWPSDAVTVTTTLVFETTLGAAH